MTIQLVPWLSFENYQLHGWSCCSLAIFWQISWEFCQGMPDWHMIWLRQYHIRLVFVKHQIWHAACYNMEILHNEMWMSHYSKFQHYNQKNWLDHAHQPGIVWPLAQFSLQVTYFSVFAWFWFVAYWNGWSLIFVLTDLHLMKLH